MGQRRLSASLQATSFLNSLAFVRPQFAADWVFQLERVMKPEFVAAMGAAIVSLALPALAQTSKDAANPQAATPSVQYRSVFRETSLGVETEKTDWRKANDDVGKFTRGHVDILKQEEMEQKTMDKRAMDAKAMDEKKSMDSKAMPAKPASPATPAPHKH
jgi:hypothetical protein